MLFPTGRQISAHDRLPALSFVGMSFYVAVDELAPTGLKACSLLNCFSKMFECFLRNVKLLIFGPSEVTLGFAHCVFARRITVSFACALRRHAKPDHGLNRDQAGLIFNCLSFANRSFYRIEVVA